MLDVLAVFLAGTGASYFAIRRALERAFPPLPLHRSGRPELDAAASVWPGAPAADADLLDWVLDRGDWVVLDLETTGLFSRSEIIEIAIVAADGQVLMDQLVMPKGRISSAATAIHGIRRQMLKAAPRWPDLLPHVSMLLSGRPVITYNAPFDMRMIKQSSSAWGLTAVRVESHCAMRAYARHRSGRGGSGRWHRLGSACRAEGIADRQSHRALDDAILTRQLILKAAADRLAARSRGGRRRAPRAEAPREQQPAG